MVLSIFKTTQTPYANLQSNTQERISEKGMLAEKL